MKNLNVLCDFDGTITIEDTGVVALDYFSDGDWRYYDDLLEREVITLEECIKRQFEMLKGKKTEILDLIIKKVKLRPNIKKFLDFCHKNNITFIVLSAGLDFAIEYFMSQILTSKKIPIYSPQTQYSNGKIKITFPELESKISKNFKQDIVKKYKTKNSIIIYIGNGLSDFEGVRISDFAYVVRNSKLANLCEKEALDHKEFTDFLEIIYDLKNRFL